MMSTAFEKFVCWKENRIGQVINTEAVSVDLPNFLATHAAFHSIRYIKSISQMPDTSEEAFLNELLNLSKNDQHVFAVIQGIPGTGKSHLIRWIKEKYFQKRTNEKVLLIERANSSLLGTIRQIIESGIFDTGLMQNELDRLKGAASELSNRGLSDSIINNLQVAIHEVDLPAEKAPPKKISRNIEQFLLDPNVRSWLKREKGPIERIVKYLSTGRTQGVDENELPGFEDGDFIVSVDLLNQLTLQGSNNFARTLARELNDVDNSDLRKNLADYLNRLLNFAIGHTTALSAEELKQMFNRLRRNLRQQNLGLVLFIEDITSFTGIDSGLIDVLATQHTGEGNRDFCRIISVVGITDSYYEERFPDNLRDRITHRLTLNKEVNTSVYESDLLQSKDAVADLVARYLNVIRTDQDKIEDWSENSGEIIDLPNHCYECVHRLQCHGAFGYVKLDDNVNSEKLNVGLYPFNKNALWEMFRGISAIKAARTPRSLLRSVIQYVLQSHTSKIRDGKFPPSRNTIGSEFIAPPLKEQTQLRIITDQGGQDANRIETLVLFWGDKTINSYLENDIKWVSGLSPIVFKAFSLAEIEGEIIQDSDKSGDKTEDQDKDKDKTENKKQDIDNEFEKNDRKENDKEYKDELEDYYKDLRDWLESGRLDRYEEFSRLVSNQVEAFYEWESFQISRTQIQERVKPAKFVFEGQFGKITSQDYILISRSQENYDFLVSLLEINKKFERLEPRMISAHLITLSIWLHGNQERIIKFIQSPKDLIENIKLTDLIISNLIYTGFLSGDISSNKNDVLNIFFDLVKISRSASNWNDVSTQLRDARNDKWKNLVVRIQADDVKYCRTQFLQSINLPQGGSKDIRFLNPILVIDHIKANIERGWRILHFEIPNNTDYEHWDRSSKIYNDLANFLEAAIDEERKSIIGYLNELEKFLGNETPESAFKSIKELLRTFQTHAIGYSFLEKPSLTPPQLQSVLDHLNKTVSLTDFSSSLFELAGSLQKIKDLKEYIKYFGDFIKMATDHEKQLGEDIKRLKAIEQSDQLIRQAEKQYDEINAGLYGIINFPDVEENK